MLIILISNFMFFYIFYKGIQNAKKKDLNLIFVFFEILFIQILIIGSFIIIINIFLSALNIPFDENILSNLWINLSFIFIYFFDYIGTISILNKILFPLHIKNIETIKTKSLKLQKINGKYIKIQLKMDETNSILRQDFYKIREKYNILTSKHKKHEIQIFINDDKLKIIYKAYGNILMDREEYII